MAIIAKSWEHFPHQSDIGVRGVGELKGDAFAQAALALTAVISNPRRISGHEHCDVDCEGVDDAALLVDWLNTVIYEMATRRMLFCQFDVWVSVGRLHARLWGERVRTQRHEPAVEVKAATHHQAKVFQREDGAWVAECVVDV